MKKFELSKITKLEVVELLALISSAAAARNEKILQLLLKLYIDKEFNKTWLYESLLQLYLFAGFPIALSSLKILSELIRVTKKYSDKRTPKQIQQEGIISCKKIYGDSFHKLVSNVKIYSPELSDWLILEGYGKVLSRKALSLKKRELLIISILSSLKFSDQLYSHIRGGFRLGNNLQSINSVIKNLKLIDQIDSSNFGLLVFHKVISANKTV
ncbi:MAG: hypothetical protein IPM56_10130 [Ignavibacteriales bacterium]|nr:MAG: hypothetical protein IPM56_10130 [Ignavibacteriales bacterium]